MARRARVVIAGLPHHVIQRGNRRQNVFFYEEDKQSYLTLLERYSKKYGLEVWAYCLMDNHVHLIVVPKEKIYLSAAIGETHKGYTRLINKREGWKGYLWEGRFKSFVMGKDYLYKAVRYVEMNPVRAKMIRRAEDYKWSSAKNRIKGWKSKVLSDFCLTKEIKDWRKYLTEGSLDEIKVIREHIKLGLPLGSEEFVKNVEEKLGMILRKLNPGRKPKKK